MTDHRSVQKIVGAGIGANHTTVWRWGQRSEVSSCPGPQLPLASRAVMSALRPIAFPTSRTAPQVR
jgi:hypothetical protein